MTRKTQVVMTAAAALTGLAVATALWFTQDGKPPTEDTPAPPHSTRPATAEPNKEAPVDPHVMAEVRDAYRSSLAEGAPPGMLELIGGLGAPRRNRPICRPCRCLIRM